MKFFEENLRSAIDRPFKRAAAPDNPIARLVSGTLTREEAKRFWTNADQQSLLFFTQVAVPHLMESCADLDARVLLWNAIYWVFGRGRADRSYPHYLQRFLVALGSAPAEMDGVLHIDAAVERRRDAVLRSSFVDALASEFIAPAALGPFAYRQVSDALAKSYSLDSSALKFFHVQADEGNKRVIEVLIPLVVRYATTDEQQTGVLSTLAAAFDQPPLVHFACKL